MKASSRFAAALAALLWASTAAAAPFLSGNDFIIAIDRDAAASLSNYPTAESPFNVLDNTPGTKYLNFGELNTGFMVQPFSGPSIIKSMSLATANDAVERDPASYAIYGTNDSVNLLAPGVDNGTSLIANWSLISQGNLTLPATRLTAGNIVSFANTTSYTTYRVLFPTVKNSATANSMQIADVGLYTANDGITGNILGIADPIAAFQLPAPDSRFNADQAPKFALDGTGPNLTIPSQSSYPANEAPPNTVDGTNNKYLNFGIVDSGFIVTPASGSAAVKSFQLTSANDAPARDPAAWQLFGTNAAIVSADNSYGTAETWTLIDSGLVAMPDAHNTLGPVVPVNNNANFASYKMIFTGLKQVPDAANPGQFLVPNSMQIAEASFFTAADGTGTDILNVGDPIKAIDATLRTGLDTKYLNFGAKNSGFIVTPTAGAKVLTSFQITTANDAPERDPASFEVYGTNSPITSAENSTGVGEAWALITSGSITLPAGRRTDGDVIPITNATAYTSYKIIFPTLKQVDNPAMPGTPLVPNSMQISGIQFFDSSVAVDVDLDNDNDVDGNDFLLIQRTDVSLIAAWKTKFGGPPASGNANGVPEPASAGLALLAAIGAFASRRRSRRGAY